MLKALDQAMHKGIYPGWEGDINKELLQRGKTTFDQPKPRKLVKWDGCLSQKRADIAASRLGRHFQLTFFDTIDGLDLYDKASIIIISVQSSCECVNS